MDSMFDYLGAANAFGNAALGVANMYLTSQAKYDDRRFASEMYERQKADNLENWNRMNEYNSPSSQMQRYVDAGLNANLMYGQGTSGNASSAADTGQYKPSFGPVPQLDKLDILGKYFSVEHMKLQNEQLEQGIEESKSRTTTNTWQNKFLDQTFGFRLAISEEQWKQTVTRTNLVDMENAFAVWMNEMQYDENGNIIPDSSPAQQQFVNELSLQAQKLKNLAADEHLTLAQVITELCKPGLMNEQINYLRSSAHLNYERAKVVYGEFVVGVAELLLKVNEQINNPLKGGQSWILNFMRKKGDLSGLRHLFKKSTDYLQKELGDDYPFGSGMLE